MQVQRRAPFWQTIPTYEESLGTRSATAFDYSELLAAARGGDSEAFERLCERVTPKVFRTLLRITKSREDAEDALQDALMSAFVNLQRFDGRSSFSTWLTRIAINATLMIMRKRRTQRELPMEETDEFGEKQPAHEFADRGPNPEDRCVERERARMLREALSNLRPRVRAAVEICQLQEHSLKETAKILGISVVAAKGRVFHAKVALRRAHRLRNMMKLRVGRAA
jgi:RNA polymerase sigma-70 factor (ECF subfamily)